MRDCTWVITGLYRYVRNPMYVAAIAVIWGQALLFGDWRLLVYGALFWLACHAFVLSYEEPTLERTVRRRVRNLPCQRAALDPADHVIREKGAEPSLTRSQLPSRLASPPCVHGPMQSLEGRVAQEVVARDGAY